MNMNKEMKKLFQNADKYNVNPMGIVLELKHKKGAFINLQAHEEETELLDDIVTLNELDEMKEFCANFLQKVDALTKPYINDYSHYQYEIFMDAKGAYIYTIRDKNFNYIEESQEYFDTKN